MASPLVIKYIACAMSVGIHAALLLSPLAATKAAPKLAQGEQTAITIAVKFAPTPIVEQTATAQPPMSETKPLAASPKLIAAATAKKPVTSRSKPSTRHMAKTKPAEKRVKRPQPSTVTQHQKPPRESSAVRSHTAAAPVVKPVSATPKPVMQQAKPSPQAIPADYLAEIFSLLKEHRHYPKKARLAGVEGTVYLKFRLDRQGQVDAVTLMRSSGSIELDRAAQRMLQRARQLPAPAFMAPEQTYLDLTIPVNFSLQS